MKKILAIILVGVLTLMLYIPAFAEMIEMYNNDFSVDAKGFTEAQFQVVDGRFQNKMEAATQSWETSILDAENQRYGNFEVTFDMKPLDISRASASFTLYFRADYNPNNTYRQTFQLKTGGAEYRLDNTVIEATKRPFTFEANKVYKIKLIAIENKFETYINDVLVLDYTDEDTNYTNGAFQFGAWDSKVAIDNFVVKAEPPPPEPILVTEVAIDKKRAKLDVGKTLQLKATVYPAEAEDPSVIWESSDPSIATVTEKGLVKALKAGTADIKVITNDGGYERACKLTVVAGAAGTASEADNGGMSPVLWIIIAAAAVLVIAGGAAGYYFLIVKKRGKVVEENTAVSESEPNSTDNTEEK